MSTEQEFLAQFLLLLVAKLTGWDEPVKSDGDPLYLTEQQKAALAVEGISLLAPYLPQEAAQQVASATERLPHRPRGRPENMMLSAGSLGGVLPSTHNPNNPPGCCIMIRGQLVCCN